ncbi:DUF3995 domain-containing protein [Paenibacillus piri]|uniref:DUF3995 domain-containing protein n=1 Tax=Paenibacillus piri TaxID=2547395 RepID=A0A4R5K645_9BACL|nr:DUF3995 domain-containing protein [Paenibacillus piri]TDF89173.1 DUF3995 domain-containing protein [Paenibacillus piri]
MVDLKKDGSNLNSQTQLQRPRYLVWSGYAVFIWSIVYMLPHLYWALDGTAGLSILKPSISESPQWKLINWIASVFLTAAGFLGIAMIYLKKRRFLSWLLLVILLAGCAVATSHGIYGIIYRVLQIAGVAGVESGPFNPKEHAYVLWDLLLFEPWFTIEGILLGILGWCYVNKLRNRRIWLTFCAIGICFGLITGLLGVRFA